MSYSRHIEETEIEDYDNEILTSISRGDIISWDHVEPVNDEIDSLLDEYPGELESDECLEEMPENEIDLLDLSDDDYNDLENYGS